MTHPLSFEISPGAFWRWSITRGRSGQRSAASPPPRLRRTGSSPRCNCSRSRSAVRLLRRSLPTQKTFSVARATASRVSAHPRRPKRRSTAALSPETTGGRSSIGLQVARNLRRQSVGADREDATRNPSVAGRDSHALSAAGVPAVSYEEDTGAALLYSRTRGPWQHSLVDSPPTPRASTYGRRSRSRASMIDLAAASIKAISCTGTSHGTRSKWHSVPNGAPSASLRSTPQ